jgi:hypothetical protein
MTPSAAAVKIAHGGAWTISSTTAAGMNSART